MSTIQTAGEVLEVLNTSIAIGQHIHYFPIGENFNVHGTVKIVTLDTQANGGGYLVNDGVAGGAIEVPGVEPAGRTGVSVSTPEVVPARPAYEEHAARVLASPVEKPPAVTAPPPVVV